jgi:Type ISP C-terminal specificity domain/N-6 DNA Methylase
LQIREEFIDEYINHLFHSYNHPNTTDELSHRFIIKNFLHELFEIYEKDIEIIPEPKRKNYGSPDLVFWQGYSVIGYMEIKPIGTDLNLISEEEQIIGYINALSNFILTNHLEFILYNNGFKVASFRITDKISFEQRKKIIVTHEEIQNFFKKFLSFRLSSIKDTEDIAKMLAKKAKLLNLATFYEIEEESINSNKIISSLYLSYVKHLTPTLTVQDFSDMYAQSVTFGLLMGFLRNKNEQFTSNNCVEFIPQSIPLIKSLFQMTKGAGTDIPKRITWIIDDICSILNTNREVILKLFSIPSNNISNDPLIPFYEIFLSLYNPIERERRGVYYTPFSVVEFIIDVVDEVLQSHFGLNEGINEENVTLLDPALGTGTFIIRAIMKVKEKLESENLAGIFPSILKENILKNFYGFELLAAPYIIAHLKILRSISNFGIELDESDRIGVYLTNTLLEQNVEQSNLLFLRHLSDEATKTKVIKQETPILVIVGNPPYSGHSYNKGKFIDKLIKDYKVFQDEELREKNPKWLQDDYVKFLRWSEWKIMNNKNSFGMIAMITNNAYLDNATFRILRKNLLNTFDQIYIINLHGNQRLNEKDSDGSSDENVFDIRPGVSIGIFIKNASKKHELLYYDLKGNRDKKNQFLKSKSLASIEWMKLEPQSPAYLFVPFQTSEDYDSWLSIKEIMPINRVGIFTARDLLTINFDNTSLKSNLETFRNLSHSDEYIQKVFKIRNTGDWKVDTSRGKLNMGGIIEDSIKSYLYRPFDYRFLYYHKDLVARPRHEILNSLLLEDNIALIIGRAGKATNSKEWDLVFIADRLVDLNIFRRGGGTVFPLKLKLNGITKINFNPKIISILNNVYNVDNTDSDIIYYLYAVLNSKVYRERFAENLDIDFPKIPFPSNITFFNDLVSLGKTLVTCQLLKSKEKTKTGFPISGPDKIINIVYSEPEQKLFINKTQYFSPISKDIYDFTIGDYQVLEKWLESRKGRKMSFIEIKHFIKIIDSIAKTINLQMEIDVIVSQILVSDKVIIDL